MSTVYKIHPAIGIGRLGSSQDYYIAPSGAGQLPTEYSTPNRGGNTFRDAHNNLLRQAAKFQVYAYDNTNPADPGTLVTVGANNIKGINWTVWVASKKSSWFQFMQQTGSGMGPYSASAPGSGYANSNDLGYLAHNINSPYNPN